MGFSFNTIGKKFLIPTLVLTMLLLNALGWFMAEHNNRCIRETLDIRASAVIDFITKFTADYFLFFDFQDFENIKKAITSDPDVEFFVIYNEQREPITEDMEIAEDDSSIMVFEREIKDEDGNVLGYIKIAYSNESLVKAQRKNSIVTAVAIAIATILLAAVIMFVARTVIIKRVNETIRVLKENEGDLTKRLDEAGEDELWELARRFNNFVESIHMIVLTVQDSLDKVSVASSQLSSTAEKLNRGSNEQKQETELVSSAMTQMSQTILDVAKNASETAEISQEAVRIAADGSNEVEKALEGMLSIAKTVDEAVTTIGELGKSSNEIGNIIRVIDEISDQTNLLALNAAIEAARAGEHGRGFAVVADEVRKLAERTGKATKEIAGMIEKIQADTEKSVTSMNAGSQEVQNGLSLAENARNALQMIVNESHKGKDMIQTIATASEQQSAASEEVTLNMKKILDITDKTSAATTQINQTSEELKGLSKELQNMVGLFKI
jgi:methyl-accepting chemotaxis protein